jgi:serine/threonine protein kinase
MNDLPELESAELEALVADLADEFLERQGRGEQPDIADYAERHPEHATVIRRVLSSLQWMSVSSVGEQPRPPLLEGALPGKGCLGDFRLLREVGRGGMGVVYEAEQISLGRRVALKVLPFAGALDPLQLQRFKNEAQAAAHLHHPNIVPVHAVGCDRGVHYHAMQFIEGRTLADLINELRQRSALTPTKAADTDRWQPVPSSAQGDPTADLEMSQAVSGAGTASTAEALILTDQSTNAPAFFRRIANLGMQVAGGLEHAHQMGVVHRDIKPANLILDPRGTVWITDFGLAQYQNAAQLTHTGCIIGTIRYMSPEQALARRGVVDHRTDIYALGMTLYELLSLKPAFAGEDRQELLRQITLDEPQPPRRIRAGIPVELETIVLKALAKDPTERYATAQEMANDLQRFVEDRPILARPPSLGQRATRWLWRHRVVAYAILAVLVLAVVGLSIGSVLLWRANQKTQEAQKATENALAKARAKQSFARRVVDEMYTEVAEAWISRQPRLEPLQRKFLLKALDFYQQLVEETSSDPSVLWETARAYRRVADIQQHLGELAEAERGYVRAINLIERLMTDAPEVCDQGQELVACRNGYGILLVHTGRLPAGEKSFEQTLELEAALIRTFPCEPRYREEMALNCANRGALFLETGNLREAETAFTVALTKAEQLVADYPDRPAFLRTLATVCHNLGALHWQWGHLDAAEKVWQQSQAASEKYARSFPNDREGLEARAQGFDDLGALATARGRLVEAEAHFREAKKLREQLTADFPYTVRFRVDLASSVFSLSLVEEGQGKVREAERGYGQALGILQQLAADYPDLTSYQCQLAKTSNNLGNLLRGQGRLVEAEDAYRRALTLLQGQPAHVARSAPYLDDLSIFLNNVGYVCWKTGRYEEAEWDFRQALAIRAELVEDYPDQLSYREILAGIYWNLGDLLTETWRTEEAESAYRQSRSHKEILKPRSPRS